MLRSPLPSRRKLLLLVALAVAVIGGAWWRERPPHDPVHHGERLSAVVMALDLNPSPGRQASYPLTIRAFGPEAVPWLIYTVEHGRHRPEKNGPLPLDDAPAWVRGLFSERWGGVRGATQMDERIFAAFALGQIGPDAAAAIPALARSIEGEDYFVAQYSAAALHLMGPASWPAVRTALETGIRDSRVALLATMARRIGTDANPAPEEEVARVLEVFTKACQDPQLNKVAAGSIGRCRLTRPTCTALNAAIPALIDLLSDPELGTREAAANALANFKGNAAAAVPRLIEMLDEPAFSGRRCAANALGFVDTAEKQSEAALRVMLYDVQPMCGNAAATALRKMGLSTFELVR